MWYSWIIRSKFMNGIDLKKFRDFFSYSQSDIGNILSVTQRTVAAFEAEKEKRITPPYANLLRDAFDGSILPPIIRGVTNKIFAEMPCEFIGLWIGRQRNSFPAEELIELILHENSARFYCNIDEQEKCQWFNNVLCTKQNHVCFCRNEYILKDLKQNNLTTWPCRNGKPIYLTGEAISNHPFKRIPGRYNHYYKYTRVESLCHIPLFEMGISSPKPILLLSMENRLSNGKLLVHSPQNNLDKKYEELMISYNNTEVEYTQNEIFKEEDCKTLDLLLHSIYTTKLKNLQIVEKKIIDIFGEDSFRDILISLDYLTFSKTPRK